MPSPQELPDAIRRLVDESVDRQVEADALLAAMLELHRMLTGDRPAGETTLALAPRCAAALREIGAASREAVARVRALEVLAVDDPAVAEAARVACEALRRREAVARALAGLRQELEQALQWDELAALSGGSGEA
jgi:hypothetical protein